MRLRIATRRSALALWQAEGVRSLLESRGHACALFSLQSEGDRVLDRSLSALGGKGLFVKELEQALLGARRSGRAQRQGRALRASRRSHPLRLC